MSEQVVNGVHLIERNGDTNSVIGIQNDGELSDAFIKSLPAHVEYWGKSAETGERIYTISQPAYGHTIDEILGAVIIFMSGDVVQAINKLNHFHHGPIPDRD